MKSKLLWIGGTLVLSLVLGVSGVGASTENVIICHKPGTSDEETLDVPAPAAPAHLKHGDYIGECEQEASSIYGVNFEDLDADGSDREFDEPGLGGWIIYVDYDNDSLWDEDTEPYAITASDGSYTIQDIDSGNWYLREVGKDGWECSFPNLGIETPPIISAGCHHLISVPPSGVLEGFNFGNWTPALISGYKWDDRYEPYGEWDQANEPSLMGWSIEFFDLTTGSPVALAIAITNGSGFYQVSDLAPGRTFAVCERKGFSYIQTFPMASTVPPFGVMIFDCGGILGQEYGPYGYQLFAQSGDEYINNNFGNMEPPS